MELQDIIALSRRYGSDPEAVLAGGGNTSAKDPHRMYIKCSGVQLATMDEAGFVPIDRHKMDVAMAQSYPAEDAAREGGTACAILNGANEEAVGLFLRQEIGFNDIARRVEDALCRVEVKYTPSLEDILEADRLARAAVLNR